jgi:hypothetical protein
MRMAPADGDGVLGRYLVGEDQRSHRRADTLGEQEVLDRERHAVKWAEPLARHHRRLGPPGGVSRLVRGHGDERVHGRLEGVDPLEHGVDHRDGGELLRADLLGEGQRVDLGDPHGARRVARPCRTAPRGAVLGEDP